MFQVRRDLALNPRSGAEHNFYCIEAVDWINIIPLTAEGEVVMIEQYRHGTDDITLEIPGGGTWTVIVKDGQVAAKPGAVPDPTVTYTIKAENYIKLTNGELNGAMAFMTRKLKVAGSITMAQKMNKFLPPLEK